MGLLSIVLSALAVVCAGIGVLTTPIPTLGLIFAFGAPAIALAGILLGGSAMSKAKREGQTSETGKIGAILSAIAFVPSVLVALTCGVCNAFFTTGDFKVHKDIRFGGSPFAGDGGVIGLPPPQRAPQPSDEPDEPEKSPQGEPPSSGPAQPQQPESPTSLPPPPLPPGPRK
jgi:hypothetical protein